MEFKLCECILHNGEMCARYIEKTNDLYCCEHMNSNIETNEVYTKPNFGTYFCSTFSVVLMSMSMLFFCGKRTRNKSIHPNRSVHKDAVTPINIINSRDRKKKLIHS